MAGGLGGGGGGDGRPAGGGGGGDGDGGSGGGLGGCGPVGGLRTASAGGFMWCRVYGENAQTPLWVRCSRRHERLLLSTTPARGREEEPNKASGCQCKDSSVAGTLSD